MTALPKLRSFARVASAAALFCSAVATAQAADRWTAEGGVASVALPDPKPASGIAGATLACAEQKWSLSVSLSPDTASLAGPVQATLMVGAQPFGIEAVAQSGRVVLPLPSLAISPLKAGTAARIAVGNDIAATFSLRGSRLAIEAAEPFCTKRDMSDYETVALTPYSSYVLEAKELRRSEIETFRQATASEPVVSATKSVMPDGRSLLFVQLCGSSWYYGASGCNTAIFARLADADEWKQVYDAEGSDLYLDAKTAVGGWPTLIALPRRGAGDEVRWAWTGDAYRLAEDDTVAGIKTPGEDDGGQ